MSSLVPVIFAFPFPFQKCLVDEVIFVNCSKTMFIFQKFENWFKTFLPCQCSLFRSLYLEKIGLALEENVDCLAVREEIYKSISSNCFRKLNAKRLAVKDLCKVRENYMSNP